MYLQTGDVLYHKRKNIPAGFELVKHGLIHQGRDHPHTIEGAFSLHVKGDSMFIEAVEPCLLKHPEHKTVELAPGIYEKGIVMEYDHLTEESRQVID